MIAIKGASGAAASRAAAPPAPRDGLRLLARGRSPDVCADIREYLS